MKEEAKTAIRLEVYIHAPLEVVWKCWTSPEDIVKWNNASSDWHTTQATNDLQTGGCFSYRMEAKDGSIGFDFGGIYDEVVINKKLKYTLGDGRKVKVIFCDEDDRIKVVETFETENENPIEVQREGWQNILNNFKMYTENKH